MAVSQQPEWPFTKLVFAVVLLTAYACAAAAIVYPAYMYSLGH
jgi:hypothetical protein